MIKKLEAWDQALFKLLNGAHNAALDILMPWISDKYIWIPLYAILLFGFIKYSGYPWWQVVLATMLLITMSDQIASGFLKPAVERLRPCYEPALEGMVHLLKGCGGSYGFASSHASNSFAVAFFAMFILSTKWKWTKWLILWAAVVAYSRIYLGVHYPGDVITGALIGWFAAFISQFLLRKFGSLKN